ncbi:hypothetical protein EVAR_75854_1 [Eumeta japonica]|uniref:Uncharacterized protein n=1 Tax=Eumeta variegata TaxID=151549 RepID=A0A4C1TD38_EUMVA|nr:hypothetical protein EVAR_75854_1 [Eumeta japonica]
MTTTALLDKILLAQILSKSGEAPILRDLRSCLQRDAAPAPCTCTPACRNRHFYSISDCRIDNDQFTLQFRRSVAASAARDVQHAWSAGTRHPSLSARTTAGTAQRSQRKWPS